MKKIAKCCYCFQDVEFEKKKKPEKCPYCNTGYWSKPPTEERCFIYQKIYLDNKEKNKLIADKALSDLYYLIEEYAIGMIKKMLRGKKILPEDTLLESGAEAAFTFIKKYLEPSEEEFKIDNSFGGQLRFILLPILHGQKVIFQDAILSLNSHIDDEGSNEKLELNNFRNIFNTDLNVEFFLQKTKEEDAVKSITKIIEGVLEDVYKSYDVFVSIDFLAGVYHKCQNAHLDFMDRFYETHGGIKVQSIVEATMTSIREFIEQKS